MDILGIKLLKPPLDLDSLIESINILTHQVQEMCTSISRQPVIKGYLLIGVTNRIQESVEVIWRAALSDLLAN